MGTGWSGNINQRWQNLLKNLCQPLKGWRSYSDNLHGSSDSLVKLLSVLSSFVWFGWYVFVQDKPYFSCILKYDHKMVFFFNWKIIFKLSFVLIQFFNFPACLVFIFFLITQSDLVKYLICGNMLKWHWCVSSYKTKEKWYCCQ